MHHGDSQPHLILKWTPDQTQIFPHPGKKKQIAGQSSLDFLNMPDLEYKLHIFIYNSPASAWGV